MRELTLDLGERSYPIRIAPALLAENDWPAFIAGNQACVVTNETIAPLYLESVLARLDGKRVSVVTLPDGEEHKTLSTLNQIFDRLLVDNHTRKTTLIALGGGVVGDMTGFAAACYQRGVPFIQLPTTLLSMVDSSVGGKTASPSHTSPQSSSLSPPSRAAIYRFTSDEERGRLVFRAMAVRPYLTHHGLFKNRG